MLCPRSIHHQHLLGRLQYRAAAPGPVDWYGAIPWEDEEYNVGFEDTMVHRLSGADKCHCQNGSGVN
jgi:hypothetical protein